MHSVLRFRYPDSQHRFEQYCADDNEAREWVHQFKDLVADLTYQRIGESEKPINKAGLLA